FMSITFLLVPVLFRRELILPKLCQIQPYLFGISMSILGLVMMGAGTLGVSRRHWDMAFSGAPFQYEWPGAAYLMMGLTGIFGVIAVIGGGLWILLIVGSLLFGKKLDGGKVSDKPTPIPVDTQAASAVAHGSDHQPVPGTVILALLLFVSFVLYYFVNWKYLSEVWLLS
ncbi:MAG: cytochrome C oxidase subunit I, partial [Candidatus Accumulibacter sp.]|nr:cytochrome C oxidase subunit I [Accumulibacter sp.]